MGYMHIDNLYKSQSVLQFKTCYALEKIHGTSAHILYKDGALILYSGGESSERFAGLFDLPALQAKFAELFPSNEFPVTVYGEAYGGKQQGMSPTYGPNLKFVVFDVKVGDQWQQVEQAHETTTKLGLEFVDYAKIPTDLEAINAERDKPSTQSVRNGITEPKIREGVVLRPVMEVTDYRGNRIIAKHKRDEFSERGKPAVELDPSKLEVLANAQAIANEWVTPVRLEHVIGQIIAGRDNKEIEMKDTPVVLKTMLEDILREAAGEIVDSPAARKAISTRTVQVFKARFVASLQEA